MPAIDLSDSSERPIFKFQKIERQKSRRLICIYCGQNIKTFVKPLNKFRGVHLIKIDDTNSIVDVTNVTC